jgi:quinol monooxygenase YgiN
MSKKIQLSAHMKIRPGKLEEFKRQAGAIIAQAKAKDPGTLQYDWFLSDDGTECEVRETYESSDALLAHVINISAPRDALFEKFATDHAIVIYGDPPAGLLQKAAGLGVKVKVYSFLQGLT